MNKLQITLTALLFLFLTVKVTAEPVDAATALSVAQNQYTYLTSRTVAGVIAFQTESYYVVNFENEGFVIVAADNQINPIIGFSTEGAFDVVNMPENVRFFMDEYDLEIQRAMASHTDVPETEALKVASKWRILQEGVPEQSRDVVVGPLIDSKWNQGKYYNNLCPADAAATSSNGHALVGCGAIVMGQVMRYWKYPTTGTGSHSYTLSDYGTLSANFGATTYDYTQMPKTLGISTSSAAVNAVATLLYHCGVAVEMHYGPNASWSNSNNIVSAMSTYFGYPTTIRYIEKTGYSASQWLQMIKNELDESAPFFYGGSGSQGGHVFVCDGYRDDNYLHINWGFGGSYDGYFTHTALNPYQWNFSSNQAIIIGIRGPEIPQAVSENTPGDLIVYPNPAHETICISNIPESNEPSLIRIMDMTGRTLVSQSVSLSNGETQYTMDVSRLAHGMYLLSVDNSQGRKTQKLIVE